ncbi:MAG: hypothetical protein M1829_004989 [Trizodia sp. TS-e1964]|nr:MAG: hypothetical protein M1829_004989 [Trizodia sp. TS-e1964]
MLNSTASSRPRSRDQVHRQPSAPYSASSSSIATVQRALSFSSRSASGFPAQDAADSPAPHAARPYGNPDKRMSSSTLSRSNSVSGIREGVGNLNRWSQSTASSKASHARANSFSRRLSFGGVNPFGSLATLASPHPPPRNVLSKSRPSPTSPPRHPPPNIPPQPPPPSRIKPSLAMPPAARPANVPAAATIATSPSVSPTTTLPPGDGLLAASVYPPARASSSDHWQGTLAKQRPSAHRSDTSPPVLPTHSRSIANNISHSVLTAPPRRLILDTSSVTATFPEPEPSSSTSSRHKNSARERASSASENKKPRDRSRSRGDPSYRSKERQAKRSRERQGSRGDKHPSQKNMLSKALQKANTAVLLDNAQNFEGAMEAYHEACQLLAQVLLRSSGDDDKRKLEAIRNTYTNRIKELQNISPPPTLIDDKALPERPPSDDRGDVNLSPQSSNSAFSRLDLSRDFPEDLMRVANNKQQKPPPKPANHPILPPNQALAPPRRDSLMLGRLDPPEKPPLPISLNAGVGAGAGAASASASASVAAPIQPDAAAQKQQNRSWSRSPMGDRIVESSLSFPPPMEVDYMPPPLSPRRPLSPAAAPPPRLPDSLDSQQYGTSRASNHSPIKEYSRPASDETTSWLDTIDESGGSSASSTHSRSSSFRRRPLHVRTASGNTEAEFDAALDDAIEAAYNEGLELVKPMAINGSHSSLSDARRNVEVAKERIRQVERELAISNAKENARKQMEEEPMNCPRYSIDLEYGEEEAEEEERMLEEMTRGYIMDDFEFDLQSKSALPRRSSSSGYSARTWATSFVSNPTTAKSSLQTVSEMPLHASSPHPSKSKPLFPPPSAALPPPPQMAPSPPPLPPPSTAPPPRPSSNSAATSNALPREGVRNRRLSGQNLKQLKIETTASPAATSHSNTEPSRFNKPPPTLPSIITNDDLLHPTPYSALIGPSPISLGTDSVISPLASSAGFRIASSPFSSSSPADNPSVSPATPAITRTLTQDSENNLSSSFASRSESPGKAAGKPSQGLRKNFSSSSLGKMRNLSVSSPDASDASPSTPMSNSFTAAPNARKAYPAVAVPALPTPLATSFSGKGLAVGGLYLFDSDIHSPTSPGSPNPMAPGAPIPLEPCPSDSLLRPFWLMRSLYQTIAHPRGGYLSTKLFVPKDVWMVKGVKLKGVEEKVSNCDFLTAALLKLGKVDTCDADAVLEEMQALEFVLDQVQASLTKKLGNDVGVQGASSIFKDAALPASGVDSAPTVDLNASKAANSSSRSFSWRRLRSKNSAVNLTSSFTALNGAKLDGSKEVPHATTISTLPMTISPQLKTPKRDVSQIDVSGPNSNYMSSLARVFDAAQVIGQ